MFDPVLVTCEVAHAEIWMEPVRLGGDLDGFSNGRRVFDNVTAIELRAVAG